MFDALRDDPKTLATDDLATEIQRWASQIAAAMCRWLLLVAEYDRRGAYAEWGQISMAHWLNVKCGISIGTAREHVRVARAMDSLPLVTAAFATGELSFAKVRAISRVAEPHTEAALVNLGRLMTASQLEDTCRTLRSVTASEADDRAEADARHRRRFCRWHVDGGDGSVLVVARLSPEDFAVVREALEAVAEAPDVPRDAERGDRASSANRDAVAVADGDDPVGAARADALVAMARLALEGADDAAVAERYRAVVQVDLAALAGGEAAPCGLQDGPHLSTETARRLTCDADVVPVIRGAKWEPLAVGRSSRLATTAQRRAVVLRDHSCRFPGCTHRRFVAVHHALHWTQGGPTDLANLLLLCSRHHRMVHEGGYRVTPDWRGGFSFYRPDNTLVAVVDDVSAETSWLDLDVAADACMAKAWGDRYDRDLTIWALANIPKELSPA